MLGEFGIGCDRCSISVHVDGVWSEKYRTE